MSALPWIRLRADLRQVSWWPLLLALVAGFGAGEQDLWGPGLGLERGAPWLLVAAVALLPARSLGDDLQSGRLWMLLASPLSRRTLFLEKTLPGLLATGWLVALFLFMHGDASPWGGRALLTYGLSIPMIFLTGRALYGFIATLCLVPALTLSVAAGAPGLSSWWEPSVGLGAYAVGYRLFARLQAEGRDDPMLSLLPSQVGRTGPWRALALKELRLQAGGIQLTAIVLLPWLLVGTPVGPPLILASIVLLWTVCPLVFGALSMAEERRLGTDLQLAAGPVPLCTQWRLKAAVSGVLAGGSVALGLLSAHLASSRLDLPLDTLSNLTAFSVVAWLCGLYASKVAREPLSALAGGTLLALSVAAALRLLLAALELRFTRHFLPEFVLAVGCLVALAGLWAMRAPSPLPTRAETRRPWLAVVGLLLGCFFLQWTAVRYAVRDLDARWASVRGRVEARGLPSGGDPAPGSADVGSADDERRRAIATGQILQWRLGGQVDGYRRFLERHGRWSGRFAGSLEHKVNELDEALGAFWKVLATDIEEAETQKAEAAPDS